jgi:hypothetical protein
MRGIFALFIRALRENVRGVSFAWMRAGTALAVLITMLFFKALHSLGAAGMEFFRPFAFYNAALIIIAALSYFASAITEEKEEQTLGLLRMTGISALAVLFGKSTSRVFSGLMLLGVQFPFALLAVTLGGMTWQQVAINYALLCSFLFFAANVALLASVFARSSAKAGALTAVLGFVFLLPGAPFYLISNIVWLVHEPAASSLETLGDSMWSPEGVRAFIAALGIGWQSALWKKSVIEFIAGGAVAFILAWALFNRFTTDESVDAGRQKGPRRSLRNVLRPGRVWNDCIAWKDYHFIHGGPRVTVMKIVIYVIFFIWLAAANSGRGFYDAQRVMWSTLFFSTFYLCLEVAFAASRAFRLEARGLTLGALYTLPKELGALMAAKRRAIMISVAPVAAVAGVSVLWAIFSTGGDLFRSGESAFYTFQLFTIIPLEFMMHYRLVMWFSLRLKWGGLPAALITSFFAHAFTTAFVFAATREAGGVVMIVILSIACGTLGTSLKNLCVARAADS